MIVKLKIHTQLNNILRIGGYTGDALLVFFAIFGLSAWTTRTVRFTNEGITVQVVAAGIAIVATIAAITIATQEAGSQWYSEHTKPERLKSRSLLFAGSLSLLLSGYYFEPSTLSEIHFSTGENVEFFPLHDEYFVIDHERVRSIKYLTSPYIFTPVRVCLDYNAQLRRKVRVHGQLVTESTFVHYTVPAHLRNKVARALSYTQKPINVIAFQIACALRNELQGQPYILPDGFIPEPGVVWTK